MKSLNIAIIGCGNIARTKHALALSTIEQVNLIGFFDVNRDIAQSLCDDFGGPEAKTYPNVEALLADPLIDVVHICTPNNTHAQYSIAAMEQGKHVMCEKPMATTVSDAQKMVATSRATGKTLSISYQNRFTSENQYLKNEVASNRLGEIYFAKAHAVRRRIVPTWGSFLNKDIQGGGALIDIGTHALDLALYLMDNFEVDSVNGAAFSKFKHQTQTGNLFGDWEPEQYTIDDSAFGFIKMKNGATLFLESSWALNTLQDGEAQVTLCGDKAGADTREGLRLNGVRHDTLYTEVPQCKEDDCLNAEMIQWILALQKGCDATVTPEQGLVVTKVLDAIYRSSETGELVHIH
jgi:predicted dehydrogenase